MFDFNAVIGIDPGAQGGLAVFIPGQRVKTVKMPKEVRDLRDFFEYYADNFKPIVFLEKLSVRPDDIKDNPGKIYRIQRMLANFEHLKAIMESEGVPYVLVHPMSWQTRLGLRVKGQHEEKAARKKRYRATAERLYPAVKTTLWNSDALLIMHFGRKVLIDDVKWVLANLPGYIKGNGLFK